MKFFFKNNFLYIEIEEMAWDSIYWDGLEETIYEPQVRKWIVSVSELEENLNINNMEFILKTYYYAHISKNDHIFIYSNKQLELIEWLNSCLIMKKLEE